MQPTFPRRTAKEPKKDHKAEYLSLKKRKEMDLEKKRNEILRAQI